MKNVRKGFTLAELLVVIVVIAILAAIASLAYSGIVNRATNSLVHADLRHNIQRVSMFMVEHGDQLQAVDISGMAAQDLKMKVSSRKAYKSLSLCTAGTAYGLPIEEVILIAQASTGRYYGYSTKYSAIRDRTDQLRDGGYDMGDWGRDSCRAIMESSQLLEGRALIHADGGVEGGFVTIAGE